MHEKKGKDIQLSEMRGIVILGDFYIYGLNITYFSLKESVAS